MICFDTNFSNEFTKAKIKINSAHQITDDQISAFCDEIFFDTKENQTPISRWEKLALKHFNMDYCPFDELMIVWFDDVENIKPSTIDKMIDAFINLTNNSKFIKNIDTLDRVLSIADKSNPNNAHLLRKYSEANIALMTKISLKKMREDLSKGFSKKAIDQEYLVQKLKNSFWCEP